MRQLGVWRLDGQLAGPIRPRVIHYRIFPEKGSLTGIQPGRLNGSSGSSGLRGFLHRVAVGDTGFR